ncbi:MAG: hypothetical protein WA913_13945 [Pricia sp.]
MRLLKILILSILGIIILSNLLPVRLFIDGMIVGHDFETENAEFKHTVYTNKGDGTNAMERRFDKFLLETPHTTDTVIYRKFERDPLEFWNWGFYMTSELYDYDLKE